MGFRRKKEDNVADLIRKKQYDKAIDYYKDYIKRNPWDVKTLIRFADVFALAGQKQKAIDMYKLIAERFVADGSLLKAIGLNKKIVRLDSTRQSAHLRLSKLYEEKGLLGPRRAVPKGPKKPEPEERASGLTVSAEIAIAEMLDRIETDKFDDALCALNLPPEKEFVEATIDDFDEISPEDLSFLDMEEHLGAKEPAGKTLLFAELTAIEFADIVECMNQHSCRKGDVIVREGERSDSLYVILEGRVKISRRRLDNVSIPLGALKAGDFFGEFSLLTGRPRVATVTAEDDAELLELTKAKMEEIVARHPRVKEILERFYQERVRDTREKMMRGQKRR